MDLNRLRLLVAAPMASLFLILSLCAVVLPRPRSEGIRVPMLRLHRTYQHEFSCDGRFEFLRLTKDGKTWINAAEIPEDQMRSAVARLMEVRAEQIVYVKVDSEVSYGQFAEFLGKIKGATPDLHIVVVSGEIAREFMKPHILETPSKLNSTSMATDWEKEPPSVCDFIIGGFNNEVQRQSERWVDGMG